MKKKVVVVVLFAALSASGIGWYCASKNNRQDSRIFVSGNIEATEVDLAFRIGGQISKLTIEEGDRIKAGTIVAELDTDTLMALKGASEAEIGAARAVLDELERGSRKEDIEMARAVLNACESRLTNARDEYDRYESLYKQHAISASQYDAKKTALKVAQAERDNALERLQYMETGPREEQIRAARNRLERALWELKKIELDLKHSILECPVDAVVLVKSNECGEVVLPGATVATVAKLDEVWLKGYVAESDLGRVKLGQKVEVTTDTYPDKKYMGTVTFISPRAEFTPKNVQTREERVKQVYRVKVTIPNLEHELKIGMPAEGYILTDQPAKSAEPGTLSTPRKSD
ncbi:MAG: efflux RND transporter periplasmic adaptor subunit [Desulfomonile sp.]|nr:efflux RND transporter periplasmic adaptor subunit [Desulfomonile sp.]